MVGGYRTDVCIPDRNLHERRPGRMAGGPGLRSHLYKYPGTSGWGGYPESHLLCVHFACPRAGKHAPNPTRARLSLIWRVVPKVGGSYLDGRLAATYSYDATLEHRYRQDSGTSGATAYELLRYRTMDGIPPIRSYHASDNNKLRYSSRLS